MLVIDDRNEGLASSADVVNHRVPKWQLLGAASCTPETRQLMWHDSDDDQL